MLANSLVPPGDSHTYINPYDNSDWLLTPGDWAQGVPGARNADGSPLSLGTVRNGSDFVAFSAMTEIDDVQIYSSPLSAYEVLHLKNRPGAQFTTDKHL
ncbi:MAG: hypothetical protein WDZ60_08880, partial [Wenzhouxiangellaceae bacterium]